MKRQYYVIFTITVMLLSVFPLVPVKGTTVLREMSRDNQKQVDLELAPLEIVKAGDFDWLRMPDSSYISTPGHPMLPIKSVVMKLPLKSNIKELVAEFENISLKETYFILPAPTPVQVGYEKSSNVTEPDPDIYGKDELYPKEWFVYRVGNGLDPETNTRVKYLTVYFYPLRYLPTQKKIYHATKASFKVSYREYVNESTVETRLHNLIVTSSLLESEAVRFARWKNSTGILSKVLDTTWIYGHYSGVDNPEKIRNCIKDFASQHQILYVTIFGDADRVPVRYAYVPDPEAGETYIPTDLYYADLDGTWDDNHDGYYADQRYDDVDGIPDVYVGRIPPSLIEYAQAAVDKTKGYQQQFNPSEDWTQRVVIAAGTGSGDGFTNPFGNAFPILKDYIADIIADKDIVKLYEIYGNLGTSSMSSQINRGALFVNFAGHGDPGTGLFPAGWLFYWIIPGFMWECFLPSHVRSLTNGLKLPVVTTSSCSTARFDDTDCIGESFVLEPDGGSIAYFGATRIAWGYPDEQVTTGLMGEMDWRIYQAFYEGNTKLGQMWGVPVTRYVQSHIWNYKYAYVHDVKTVMEFIMFGDPTLRIYNGPETLYVPAEYGTIQGAVNSAYDGDTIMVSAGTYFENVVLNKTVSLVGENPNNTIVNGNEFWGDVISVTSSNVWIENFTIRPRAEPWSSGMALQSSNCVIKNNIIKDACYGMLLAGSNNTLIRNILRDNTFNLNVLGSEPSHFVHSIDDSNLVNGKPVYYLVNQRELLIEPETCPEIGYLALINCTNMTVKELTLTNNHEGLLIAYTNNTAVTNNTIKYNVLGIDLYYSSNNTIFGNSITANFDEDYGFGINLRYSSNNNIQENNINANPIGIYLDYSANNSIQENDVGEGYGACVSLSHSSNNNISGNNITDTNYYGIYLRFSSSNTVCGNNIIDNFPWSIDLYYSSNNTIYGNNIETYGGIIGFHESSHNIFFHNNFQNIGIDTYASANVWDDGYPSGGNFWSDYSGFDAYSGSYQNETGSDGIGDTPFVIDTLNKDRYPLMKLNGWIQNTTILFSLTPNPVYLGQTVTLVGSLKDEYNRPLNDVGLNIYSNGRLVAKLSTNSTGWFKAAGTPGSAGTYEVKVCFNGTETKRPSSHSRTLMVLSKLDTNVSFALSPNPATLGETVELVGSLTDQYDNPIGNVAVEALYSIDDGATWLYGTTLQTNSTGWFTARGKLTLIGNYLIKIQYDGDYMYNSSSYIVVLTVEE